MSDPYLDLRFMRIVSNSKRDLVSSKKLEVMKDGPGGSVLPYLRWNSRDLIRAATHKETTTMNQVSIVDE
ncbi:hypothetical protein L2E82_14076 [Cichorium intybus]|uniref:Uncharacterized protein n=1 Tax=Cichorium intybus TaxID=13427 RepID=A0ACB9EZD6_CICIN|nr:hypothetical protein L2E82_14076 [Cichorium intybus]